MCYYFIAPQIFPSSYIYNKKLKLVTFDDSLDNIFLSISKHVKDLSKWKLDVWAQKLNQIKS